MQRIRVPGLVLIIVFGFSLCTGTAAWAAANRLSVTESAKPDVLRIGNAEIEIRYGFERWALPRTRLTAWIAASAQAVSRFYGSFPVAHLHVMVNSTPGHGINGTSYAGLEPVLVINLGKAVSESNLQEDWVMVHEMVHLAFPPVPKRHHWIEEGLATYVEPLARAEAGLVSVDRVWLWFINGLPNGLPKAGDRGLDHTPTWGRTYWGGALYCLLADMEIRQRTDNRFALKDALRAIVTAGGTMAVKDLWSLTHVLAIGDKAVGVPVLTDLYEKMKATPIDIDLEELWQRLGVATVNQTIVYSDDAPLAWLRQALTQGSGVVDVGLVPRHPGEYPIVSHRLKNLFPEIHGTNESRLLTILSMAINNGPLSANNIDPPERVKGNKMD